ncbi:YjcZ-like protein [Natronincola peptidivorans]|uniref:YjcZ-like protein n=1 Tax=Natronincola peptidivorans TaxID=426128 RepID=A0A1I0EMC0_9FIRM|nr:diguanylate cyclase regulator RdcB family protein [Natronincola peptidivorans]SET45708.1 YjcZ-like protein [Natronincola peptidivorans]
MLSKINWENLEINTNEEDNDWKKLIEEVPILKEKMIVDFVNGLEVTNDHIRVRASRQGPVARLWDGITGKSAQRQQIIDQNFSQALQTTKVWLQNLQSAQIESNYALNNVINRLNETRQGVTKLINHHLQLKQTVSQLYEELEMLEVKFLDKHIYLKEEIERLGLRQSAMIHLDKAFDAWESGRKYKGLSPFTQLILVLEELYWSPFGEYDQINQEFREQLKDKCVIQLRRITGLQGDMLVPTEQWFTYIASEKVLYKDMLRYILIFEENKYNHLPISSTIINTTENAIDLNNYHNDRLPLVLSPSRLSERLIRETGERLYV